MEAAGSAMSDRELVTFLGMNDCDPLRVAHFIACLPPERRFIFDRMRDVELWDQGLGLLPDGVLVDFDRKAFPTGRQMMSLAEEHLASLDAGRDHRAHAAFTRLVREPEAPLHGGDVRPIVEWLCDQLERLSEQLDQLRQRQDPNHHNPVEPGPPVK